MSKQTVTYGPGVFGLLGILFIGLKLTGYIAWSWVWVLAPFWVPVTVFVVLMCITLVALAIKRGRV